jgi:hypothetical protein
VEERAMVLVAIALLTPEVSSICGLRVRLEVADGLRCLETTKVFKAMEGDDGAWQSILNVAKSYKKICCSDAIGAPVILAHLARWEPHADEVAVAEARNLLGEGRLGAPDFVVVVDFSSYFFWTPQMHYFL